MTKEKPFKNTPREIALFMVMEVFEEDKYLHKVAYNNLKKHQELDKRDRAFITRICNGTIKHCITIDYIINIYASLNIEAMKPLIRNLLRISVYQIFYMDQVPISAICNEAVKISKNRGFSKLSGFINGILRKIAREYTGRDINQVKLPNKEIDINYYLSIKYSMPIWIVKKIVGQYNVEIAEEVLKDSLEEKQTTIRTNTNKIKPKDLKDILKSQDIIIEEHEELEYGFKIKAYDYLESLKEFRDGLFTVQDFSSMLVVEIADIKKEDFVVDVCAAPGGKSLHAAEKAKIVSARDLTTYKVSLINDNIKRLGIDNIDTKVFDASKVDNTILGKADVIIADLPCSGLGVLRKKADIKYKLKEEQLDELVALQREILSVVSAYVKDGGILIFSTCTINKSENIENLQWFLNNYNFKLEDINNYIPTIYQNETTKEGYLQLLPGINNLDGFFLARLKNVK